MKKEKLKNAKFQIWVVIYDEDGVKNSVPFKGIREKTFQKNYPNLYRKFMSAIIKSIDRALKK